MSTVRLRRLTADFANLSDYVQRHPRIRLLQANGDPPEQYQLEYRINSVRMVDGEVQPVKTHLVEIVLPRNYPRTPPQCRMLSPVFHPNIAPHAICVGDHWSSGEPLQSIVIRIGELLAYQSYNVKSPLNGEAARWVEKNELKMPLDKVSLLVEDVAKDEKSQQQGEVPQRGGAASDPAPSSQNATSPDVKKTPAVSSQSSTADSATSSVSASKAADPSIRVSCPHCDKAYRLRAGLGGRKVQCAACKKSFEVPSLSNG